MSLERPNTAISIWGKPRAAILADLCHSLAKTAEVSLSYCVEEVRTAVQESGIATIQFDYVKGADLREHVLRRHRVSFEIGHKGPETRYRRRYVPYRGYLDECMRIHEWNPWPTTPDRRLYEGCSSRERLAFTADFLRRIHLGAPTERETEEITHGR